MQGAAKPSTLATLQKQLTDWDQELLDSARITQARTDEISNLYSGVRDQVLGLEGRGMKATAAETAKLVTQGYEVGADGLTSGNSAYSPVQNPAGFTEWHWNGRGPISLRRMR